MESVLYPQLASLTFPLSRVAGKNSRAVANSFLSSANDSSRRRANVSAEDKPSDMSLPLILSAYSAIPTDSQ